MKIFQPILLFILSTLFISSCAVNNDFSKRKYLKLKAHIEKPIANKTNEALVQNANSSLNLSELEINTPIAEKADLIPSEITDFEKENSVSNPIENQTIELNYERELTLQLASNDPIIVDSTNVKEDVQKEIEKESQTKDPKRTARIVLSIVLSILIAAAGILTGIYIMHTNESDGSFFSAIYFFFVAVFAIAIMLIASLIALFLLISVLRLL